MKDISTIERYDKGSLKMRLKLLSVMSIILITVIMSSLVQAQTVDTLTLDQAIQQVMKNHPLIEQAGR